MSEKIDLYKSVKERFIESVKSNELDKSSNAAALMLYVLEKDTLVDLNGKTTVLPAPLTEMISYFRENKAKLSLVYGDDGSKIRKIKDASDIADVLNDYLTKHTFRGNEKTLLSSIQIITASYSELLFETDENQREITGKIEQTKKAIFAVVEAQKQSSQKGLIAKTMKFFKGSKIDEEKAYALLESQIANLELFETAIFEANVNESKAKAEAERNRQKAEQARIEKENAVSDKKRLEGENNELQEKVTTLEEDNRGLEAGIDALTVKDKLSEKLTEFYDVFFYAGDSSNEKLYETLKPIMIALEPIVQEFNIQCNRFKKNVEDQGVIRKYNACALHFKAIRKFADLEVNYNKKDLNDFKQSLAERYAGEIPVIFQERIKHIERKNNVVDFNQSAVA